MVEILAITKNPNIVDEKDAKRVFAFAVVTSLVTILLYIFWVGYPLLNTIYLGVQRYNVGWWMLLFLSLNLALPYSLLNSLGNPKSISRLDVHFLMSWLAFFFNLIVLIGLLVFWFFILNTVFSGFLPFNSHAWCCVFYSSSYCPTIAGPDCVPNPSYMDLYPNAEFYWHLGLTAMFFIASIFFIGINKLLRTTGIVQLQRESIEEGKQLGITYVFVSLVVYIVWAGVPLANTIHSTLFGFYFWTLFVLAWNVLSPYLLLLAMVNQKNGSILWPYAYLIATIIMAIFSGIIMIIMIFNSIFSPTDQFSLQHLFFALLFLLLQAMGIWIYFRLKTYGAIR